MGVSEVALIVITLIVCFYAEKINDKIKRRFHETYQQGISSLLEQRSISIDKCEDKGYNCDYVKKRCQLCYRRKVKILCGKTCDQCFQSGTRKCDVTTTRNRNNLGLFGRMVSGRDSGKGYFPWQVAIYYEDSFSNVYFECGGTLIDDTHVLSAAHCFVGMLDKKEYHWFVVLGDFNRGSYEGTEQDISVEQIIMHKGYNRYTLENDIAILKLLEAAKISDYIQTICLPKANEEKKPGSKCWISGWGKKASSLSGYVTRLQEQELPIVDQQICNVRNRNLGRRVTDKMMCTGYNNGISFNTACQGDSGGPLSCETKEGSWRVFGIISWGSPQCNGLEHYTVYTKVTAYLSWIRKHASCSL